MKWKLKVFLAVTAAAVLAVCARNGAKVDDDIIGDKLLEFLLFAPPVPSPRPDSLSRS